MGWITGTHLSRGESGSPNEIKRVGFSGGGDGGDKGGGGGGGNGFGEGLGGIAGGGGGAEGGAYLVSSSSMV